MQLKLSPDGRRVQGTTVRPEQTSTPPQPSESVAPLGRRRLVPRWSLEIALLGGLYFVYELIRGFQSADTAGADRTGWALLHWEQRWHLAVEAPLNAALKSVPPLAVLCSYYYATLHFVITPLVLIFLYRRHPSRYGPARTALILATAAALLGYFFLPTAPPRLLAGGGFTDTLASVSQWGWWGNEASAPKGFGSLTNQLAAMPSMHVGWSLWCGWCLYRYARSRIVRILGLAYPVATTLVVMSTANHYLVDALAGSLLVVSGWAAVRGYQALRERRNTAAPAVLQIPEPRQPVPLDDRLPASGRTSADASDQTFCRSG